MQTDPSTPCPCGSATALAQCCGLLIYDAQPAATAQALMRSRYSAYVLMHSDYLLRTWHPDTRPAELSLDAAQHWLGLKIKSMHAGEPSDNQGQVEFVARFKINGRGHRLHEHSHFKKLASVWLYHSGVPGNSSR